VDAGGPRPAAGGWRRPSAVAARCRVAGPAAGGPVTGGWWLADGSGWPVAGGPVAGGRAL